MTKEEIRIATDPVDSISTMNQSNNITALLTAAQLEWHCLERELFVCIDPATWQNQQYDDHSTPLDRIDPRADPEFGNVLC